MTRFLLDANLSPETGQYLASTFEFDVDDLYRRRMNHLHDDHDDEIVKIALREERVIITFGLDFGEIYHRRERGRMGVNILRLEDQTIASVNLVLDRFFRSHASDISLESSLVVLEGYRVRIASGP